MSRFLSIDELSQLGLARFGENVLIDRSVILVNPGNIALGSHVRIDAFVILIAGSAGIQIGNRIHIGARATIYGGGGEVIMEDFTGISAGVILYTATDDFVEGHLTGPMVPLATRKVREAPVILRRHSGVGAGSVVLPGVELEFGSAVGAMTLVRKKVEACTVISGNPSRVLLVKRDRPLLQRLEREVLSGTVSGNLDRKSVV